MPRARDLIPALGIIIFIYFVTLFLCALDEGCSLTHMTPM